MTISYKEFMRQSKTYINKVAVRCEQEYGIGGHQRVWYDQHTGEISFFDNDIKTVKAKFQSIGSLHIPTQSWLWSWDNNNILPHTKDRMWAVKTFGEENGFTMLTEPLIKRASIKMGSRLAAMAITILQAEGGYKFDAGNGLIIHLALFEIQKIPGWSQFGSLSRN